MVTTHVVSADSAGGFVLGSVAGVVLVLLAVEAMVTLAEDSPITAPVLLYAITLRVCTLSDASLLVSHE